MIDPGPHATRAVRMRELFASAVEVPTGQRDEWLSAQTRDDPSLLEEVRELLAANAEASGLFSSRGYASPTAAEVPPSMTGSVLPVGGRIDHYRLDAWIGAGAMGQVFKAWDLALDRPAAVKLIRSDMGQHQVARQLREVDAAAQLQHPAIATFFEGGSEDGNVYLAMELVEGTTLRQRLAAGPVPPTEALTIVTGLLEALAHAHSAGLLHRDIKPENVMLTAAGRPKLLDFGIARALSLVGTVERTPEVTKGASNGAATGTGLAAGTPGYMSPEQLRGELLTPASDVFQVGVVLFEMLTGSRTFGEGSTVAKIAATLAGPPDFTPLATLRPYGLNALVAKALAFDAKDRFESAAAFLRQVDALVDGRLRRAIPDSLVVAGFEAVPSASRDRAFGAVADLPADHTRDWVGPALTHVLSDTLARQDDLRVASGAHVRRAVMAIGTQGAVDPVRLALTLGVRWVVAGEYDCDRERLSVTVRLIDASTAAEVRSADVAGAIEEILSKPKALAAPVIEALALRRTPEQSVSHQQSRAVELHQQAQQLWQTGDRGAHPRVFALLDEALAVSPDFVPALALLAASRGTSFIASRDPADLARALAAADRAIALDPRCAEAWSWRAYALLRQQHVDEALASYERATQAGDDPMSSYLYGSTLASLGRFEAALSHLQQAVTLEPRHGIGWLSLGWTLHSLLREEAALFALGRAKALEGQPGPTFVAGVGGYIAEILRSRGELDLARTEALQGLESIERSDHSYRDTIRAFCLCALGRVSLAQADVEGARAACSQAVAQMRARTLTLAGGHVFVQALAGLARATGVRAYFDEALDVFDMRKGYSFNPFFGCADDTTAFELALAADALQLRDEASRLLTAARRAGSRRPFEPREPLTDTPQL